MVLFGRLPWFPGLWLSSAVEHVLAPSPAVIRIGRLWFQWRGFSPLPLALLCLVLPADYLATGAGLAVVGIGMIAAEVLRLWAVGYAGSATRTRGDSVPTLVHAGPFRHVRNPLYLANLVLYTLCGVAFGFFWLSLAILVYFGAQYAFIVAFEEETLRREFGVAYDYYRARVPRWVPMLRPAVEASGHRFDLLKALRSERSTLLALGLIGGILVLKRIQ